ncbi:MAG: hypothetical protein J0H27_12355 [Xanthomonadales bacterium]|nr:hypothetical protein [Xanthomonadales bacterium]
MPKTTHAVPGRAAAAFASTINGRKVNMNIRHTLLALALTASCGQALASSPAHRFPPPGENRIVGMWHLVVTFAPCAGGPSLSILSLNTFHAGGTLTSTDATPPPVSGPAQGIWEYEGHNRYSSHTQFNGFLADGTYDGLRDIYQDLTLDRNGMSYTSAIYSRVLNVDGSLRVELCGAAQGVRVPIDSNP